MAKKLVMGLLIILFLPILVYAADEPDLEVVGYEFYGLNRTTHEVPIEEEIWIKVEIENDGDEDADNVEVRVIFEETEINTTVEVGDIDAGNTRLSKKVMITDDSGDDSIDEEGTYYLTIIVDPDDDIEESDEDNNERDSGSAARIKFYDPECGDGYCDGGEDSDDCCNDCGCPSGEECNDDDECEASNECDTDSDCDDSDFATSNECSGEPKECHYFTITDCADDDGYCPTGCSFDEDDDCHECLHDSNCDDKKASTKDECTGTPRKCKHSAITGCTDNDGYCPLKCDYTDDDDCNKPAVCGDSTCEDNETKSNCCKDCGCEEGFECKDNACEKTTETITKDALDDSVKLTVMKDNLEDKGYDLDHFSLEESKSGHTFTYNYINDDGNEVVITGTVTEKGNVKNIKKTGEKSYALPIIGLLGIVFVVGAIIMVAMHMRSRPHTGYVKEERHYPRHETHHGHTGAGLFAKEAPSNLHEKIREWKIKGASDEKIRHALIKKYSKHDVDEAFKRAHR